MKVFILTILTIIQLNQADASSESVCGRENFSIEELNNPYGPGSKTLMKYSAPDSARIADIIVKNAIKESNTSRPCLKNTRSCVGANKDWSFNKELIFDNFGNPLRLNGQITSKHYIDYPAGKFYEHRASVGYSCSWGGGLQPQCIKWCSLTVIDDRWHD